MLRVGEQSAEWLIESGEKSEGTMLTWHSSGRLELLDELLLLEDVALDDLERDERGALLRIEKNSS